MKIGCVIMASGLGKRFGSNKLMHPFGDGPMIRQILKVTGFIPGRIVVTRHRDVALYCDAQSIPVLLHDLPLRSDTVRLGLSALLEKQPDLQGCLFAAADQPCLKEASVAALCTGFANDPACIYRLCFEGTPGNPVLFPKSCFSELLHLPEGRGGSTVIKNHPELVRLVQATEPKELVDVDTPETLQMLQKTCT